MTMSIMENTKARCRACPHGCYHLTVGPVVVHLSSGELCALKQSVGSVIDQALLTPTHSCAMLRIANHLCLQLTLDEMFAINIALQSSKSLPYSVQ